MPNVCINTREQTFFCEPLNDLSSSKLKELLRSSVQTGLNAQLSARNFSLLVHNLYKIVNIQLFANDTLLTLRTTSGSFM